MIKNLVFKGGGILGIAYAGAICELEKRGTLKTIERVAGTSAGSIVALLISLKYTSREIDDVLSDTDFKSFEDGINPLKIMSNYGLYKGDVCLEWIEKIITDKGLKKDANFQDFRKAGFLDLNVFATDMNEQCAKRFSFDCSQYVCVAEAVRASMSIPLFFRAFRFTNLIPDSHLYVDGGLVYNYPLEIFDTTNDNDETLGLFLTNTDGAKENNELDYNHFTKYIKALVVTMLDAQNIGLSLDKADIERTIMIDNCGISPINFDIDVDQKIALFKSGQQAVLNYYEKH